MQKLVLSALCACLLAISSQLLWTPAATAAPEPALKKVYDLLARWRADEAEVILAPMLKYRPSSKIFLRAMVYVDAPIETRGLPDSAIPELAEAVRRVIVGRIDAYWRESSG